MTRIIGHRGAAGMALENTLQSFRAALATGVYAVEFDVHTTKDGVFVVCHDATLKRVSGSWATIKQLTYAELQRIPLKNGETVPTLTEVLELVRAAKAKAVVEAKAITDVAAFCDALDPFANTILAVASFNADYLTDIRRQRPAYRLYAAENFQPLRVLLVAKRIRANGIDLNFWLLNPLTYWLARRRNLDIMIYTLDWPLLWRCIRYLYPRVDICTNQPQKFISARHPAAS